MLVSSAVPNISSDPVIDGVLAALTVPETASAVVVTGAPGFGKSSVLAAVFSRLHRKKHDKVIWLSGGVIASERHLLIQIADQLGGPEWNSDSIADLFEYLSKLDAAVVLAIDDFDALVFKREPLSTALGALLARNRKARLIGTCRPSARERLISPDHPFVAASNLHIASITLQPLDRQTGVALVSRRAPRLSRQAASLVVEASGGHPAAIVYLARLAELAGARKQEDLRPLLQRAAEFAGTVYSESWASLGPQQKAVLSELSLRHMSSAAEIAAGIGLPASHVSAQITRLVADGLVTKLEKRGLFTVAPLLAGWIAGRAARRPTQIGSTLDVVSSPKHRRQDAAFRRMATGGRN